MNRFFVMVATMLFVGCHRDRSNNADAALAGQYLAQLQGSHPGMTDACVRRIRSGEIGLTGWIDNPDCFDMLPDQRWTGKWDSGWEWSVFCPDGTTKCEANRGIWLTSKVDFPKDLAWGTYHVQFIGRRTRVPGYFGHQDQYAQLMVVDKFISIQKIPGQKYVQPFPK